MVAVAVKSDLKQSLHLELDGGRRQAAKQRLFSDRIQRYKHRNFLFS